MTFMTGFVQGHKCSLHGQKQLNHSSKCRHLSSTEERKAYRFGTTWVSKWWQNLIFCPTERTSLTFADVRNLNKTFTSIQSLKVLVSLIACRRSCSSSASSTCLWWGSLSAFPLAVVASCQCTFALSWTQFIHLTLLNWKLPAVIEIERLQVALLPQLCEKTLPLKNDLSWFTHPLQTFTSVENIPSEMYLGCLQLLVVKYIIYLECLLQ